MDKKPKVETDSQGTKKPVRRWHRPARQGLGKILPHGLTPPWIGPKDRPN
jgi:hypothetical protein